MSTTYDSHSTTSFYPPHKGKTLIINLLKRLITFVALFMAVFDGAASSPVPSVGSDREIVTDSTRINFRQSQSTLDLGLDGNRERLDNLIRHIQEISGQDSTFVISTLRVIGSASPEG